MLLFPIVEVTNDHDDCHKFVDDFKDAEAFEEMSCLDGKNAFIDNLSCVCPEESYFNDGEDPKRNEHVQNRSEVLQSKEADNSNSE
jgi:hypothetical protein